MTQQSNVTFVGVEAAQARIAELTAKYGHPCNSGQCRRQAPKGIWYCCKPCADAWEAVPRYEVHGHSDACHQRTPQWLRDQGW